MADPQYTDAQLSDGTTLRFNGQLTPDQVQTKVAAYRASLPPRHHGAGGGWGPELDAPKDDLLSKIGSYVPEAATAPLAWAQKHYVQPAERYLQTVDAAGRELGRETLGMGSDPVVQKKYGMEQSVPLHTALGVAGTVGSVAATTALDPRNWPLMAGGTARPLLQRLMSAGFGAQMTKGAIESTKQLYQNWDKLTPEERAELGTSAGLNTLMARVSLTHAVKGGAPPSKEEIQADAATSPGSIQHTQAPEVTPVTKAPAQTPNVSPEAIPSVSREAVTPPVSNVSTPDPRALAKTEPQPITPPVTGPGGGFTMPKEGEVSVEQHSYNYPDNETSRFRAFKKLEYTQRELRIAERTGDQAAIDAAQKRVLNDTLTWAKYATPDDIGFSLENLDKQASGIGNRLARMRELVQELRGGRASFYSAKDARLISRNEFRKTAGIELPSVPKDFVGTLPEEIQNSLPLSGRERKEAVSRLWAIQTIRDQAVTVGKSYSRVNELAQAIADAKGSFPARRETGRGIPATAGPEGVSVTDEPIAGPRKAPVAQETPTAAADAKLETFYRKARGEKPTETPVSPEMGGAAPAPAEPQPLQPTQAAQATARPGEPVRPAEGPSLAGPPSGAEAKAPPKQEQNIFALAQEALRGELGREPSTSEVLKRATDIKAKLEGVEDPRVEARAQALIKKGMARGTATRIAKEELASLWTDEQGRAGLPGSVPHVRRQPMIGPLGPPPTWRLANFLDRLATLGGILSRSPEETRARNITREMGANLALDHLRLEKALKDAIDRHEPDGLDEIRTFMDAGEGKIAQGPVNWSTVGPGSPHPQAPFISIEDVGTAQELHAMFQERWAEVQKRLDKEPGGIDNYLSHLWKRPGLGKQTMAAFFGRRPLEGSKTFLKHRFYEYFSDGLDHGLEPITNNPIRMQLTALFQIDKFLAAHELKDMYKEAGLVNQERLHPDWQMLNDKIFQPQRFDPEAGGVVHYKPYWAPPDVAKIFNRYLDPGLRGNPTYDRIRQYGNFLNQINLGVSGAHGAFITAVSAASDVGLGIQKIFNNQNYTGGVKDIVRGFLLQSAIKDYQLGRKIQAEAINPTGNTNLQAYVDDLIKGGARFDQDPLYETTARKFFTAMKTGHPIEAIKSGVQNLAKPIMKYYVPRIKLGMAARMMEGKLDYMIKQGITDPATISNEMGKIWDSVDNRAGQMVYDNLFWNKTAKDLSFLGIRAVGWDYGSVREGLGGMWKDPLQQIAKGLRGERPEVTPRMAFVAGTALTVAMVGAVTNYLAYSLTNNVPPPRDWKLEDYYYPFSGRIGPDGKPERMSYFTYMRDVFSVSHDVKNLQLNTALHKAHPMINQLSEFLQNKDFYNTEIRSEGDPWYDQVGQTVKWYGKSFLPFSYTMAEHRRQGGGISALEAYGESLFGITRAPSYVTQSPAEQLTLDFSKRHWQAGPLSSREREQRDTYDKFRTQVSLGKLDSQEVSDAFRAGTLRESDLYRLFENTGLSPMEQEFKSSSLKLPDALKIMQVANKEERERLKPLLIDKVGQLKEFPVPEEQAYYLDQIQKYLQ